MVGGDRDAAAAVGEFHGVGNQVEQDLLEGALVRRDLRQIGRQAHGEIEPGLPRFQRQEIAAVADHLVRRERLRRNLEIAGLHLRHVEDAIDDREQMCAGIVDQLGVFLAARAVEPHPLLVHQHVREADDGIERRAQFVAHVGEKFHLRGIGLIGFGARVIERLLLHLTLGDVAHHRDHFGLAGLAAGALEPAAAHFDPDELLRGAICRPCAVLAGGSRRTRNSTERASPKAAASASAVR